MNSWHKTAASINVTTNDIQKSNVFLGLSNQNIHTKTDQKTVTHFQTHELYTVIHIPLHGYKINHKKFSITLNLNFI